MARKTVYIKEAKGEGQHKVPINQALYSVLSGLKGGSNEQYVFSGSSGRP